jgi:acetyl-CoA synthetase
VLEIKWTPDGKGLNIAYEAVDRHAQNHLKIQLHFVLFEKTEVPSFYSDLKIKVPNLLMSLKKIEGQRACFLANGRIPELYYRFRNAEIYRCFCPLFSVFGPEPIYQSQARCERYFDTTQSYMKKNKTIGATSLSSLYHPYGCTEHLSENTILSILEQAPTDFKIPETNPEDAAFTILPVELPECQRFTCASCCFTLT